MLDIVQVEDELDLGIQDSVVGKAGNVLSVQLGSLEYAPDFGVDLAYFLQSGLQFQNSSFKSYLVQRLVASQVNVTEVVDQINALYEKLTFYVDDANKTSDGGMIA